MERETGKWGVGGEREREGELIERARERELISPLECCCQEASRPHTIPTSSESAVCRERGEVGEAASEKEKDRERERIHTVQQPVSRVGNGIRIRVHCTPHTHTQTDRHRVRESERE